MSEEKIITGFPSIDKPWHKYYTEVQNTEPFHGTLYQHIYENNKDYPKDMAIQYFGRNITYSDMFENIERVSKAFTAYGIKKGDNVALLMYQCKQHRYAEMSQDSVDRKLKEWNDTCTW